MFLVDFGADNLTTPFWGEVTTQQPPETIDNVNSIDDVIRLFNRSTAWLLFSLFCGICWIVYITFYSSRVTGLVMTKFVNRFVKSGRVHIGSISLSVLSGKVMFRDVSFITEDCSYRVQDGWIIFRWWRAYVPKDISEDFSHSDTRLSILLNGFEYHLYNRSELYSRFEKLFGLDPLIIPSSSKQFGKGPETESGGKSHPKPPSAVGYSWRDLIPVIKLELCSGRIVYGNSLTPYTLAVVVEEAHLIYTTKPAASKLDHFMHIVKSKAENFKVMLSPSPKYTGLKDDPPRLMGEGFGVVTSNKVEFYYYMDEPGVVPNEPQMLQLANGDLVEANPPIWGIDIKCGKGTDFSYGPWADRQREALFKMFFPQDYQPLKKTSPPAPGEERQIQSLDIRLSTLTDATVDILFSKDEETNAVHMNVGPGSYLEVTIPWLVHSDGYATKITGQLLHLEASTSLQFRDLVVSETLQFNVKSQYPLNWNDHQEWTINLTGCKATAYLIYAHKWFFQEALINDWSSRTPPDLLHFIPYTWKIDFCLKEFELITTTNEYNWIDCSSQHHENTLIGACGELFELSFSLPFDEFLPATVQFKFWIQIECGDLNFYVPEVSTAYVTLQSLIRNAKVRNRDGSIRTNLLPTESATDLGTQRGKVRKWRNVIQPSDGWIECWSVPICAVSIVFTYHPMPPLGPSPQADVPTPEKEEILLQHLRMPEENEIPLKNSRHQYRDPLSLTPDKVQVELEVGPSVIMLYGSLLALIINLKENVFGEYQDFMDMEKFKGGLSSNFVYKGGGLTNPSLSRKKEEVDPRVYRPLDVTVSATLHDVRGHLLKNCNEQDPPCPTICVERFGFEMDKRYDETILQVLLSPIMLIVRDNVHRPENADDHLKEGYLMLSGLQIRGHAMFSNEGRGLEEETLEYGWLVEILLGKLSGRLSAPHLENIATSCETFFLLALDMENSLRSPSSFLLCYHGNNQFDCPIENTDTVMRSVTGSSFIGGSTSPSNPIILEPGDQRLLTICPTAEEIKYKMVRVSVDAIDIYLVEAGTALSLWVSPIRCGLCNLHGSVMKEGFTLLLPNIQLRHFVMVNPSFTKRFQFSDLNNIQSSSETMTASWTSKLDTNTSVPQSPVSQTVRSWSYLWLEAGAVALGPLCVEMSLKGSPKAFETQNTFLMKHDRRTKRLFFLWRKGIDSVRKESEDSIGKDSKSDGLSPPKCSCVGGSKFFGSNASGHRFFWPSRKDWVDGVNVACFRVNKAGEDYGFGQSILKPSVLIFDTPPYTTQGVSLLELHSEWRDGTVTKSGKTPLTFKPSLLADLSHTSSSAPSTTTRSDRMSNYGSTLQSFQNRRCSHPNQSLKRQSQVMDPLTQSSDSRLNVENEKRDKPLVPPNTLTIQINNLPDSKLGLEHFQSADEMASPISEESDLITQRHKIMRRESGTEDIFEEDTIGGKKMWPATSMNSLDSLSDVSFISALSAHEECMVNLQSHLNKPIAESSLLMPCYMSHLTQLKCDNWHVSAPAVGSDQVGLAPFVKALDGKLVYAGSKYTPHFDPLVDGFTTLAMVDSSGGDTGKTSSSESGVNTPSQTHFWDTPTGNGAHFPHPPHNTVEDKSDEEFYQSLFRSFNDSITSSVSTEFTTIIVRTKNDVNVMVSPMLLEALQKFIEALTPTLSSLHPLTVVNHLHSACISRVVNANLLKKEKSILLTKIQNSKRNTAVRAEEMSPVHSNIFEEITQRGIQGSVTIPKINITLLQASVVEEVISFSALDNIRDLMCVSLLALAIEQTRICFSFNEQTKKSVQVLYRPSILPKAQKKRKSKVSTTESMLAEPVFIENSEKESELISTAVTINRIHAQLRRLKNDSSILREAVITAIPNQHSKVLFRFTKIPCGLQDMKESMSESSRDTLRDSSSILISMSDETRHTTDDTNKSGPRAGNGKEAQTGKCPDEKLGFIMCECAVEGITLKGVKNAEIPQKVDEKEEECGSVTLCNESYNFGNDKGSSTQNPSLDGTILIDSECKVLYTEERKEGVSEGGEEETGAKEESEETLKKHESYFKVVEEDKGQKRSRDKKPPSVSCVIQLNRMWYNFAAPPQTPITRKIDYTRVDWNLVSTASTAINAWLNPIDHLTLRIVSMLKGHSKRVTGLLASLMAEALEIQAIHQPSKSKYSRLMLTPLAKTLQDDPSCQLCVVLQRFIDQTPRDTIEANVCEPGLPELSTLRQGVIVLSRQWKNVLYTPLLLEHNLKSKKSKNFTVTFTLPHSEEESPGSDGEMSGEETTDERATLLDIEGGTVSLQSMRINKRSRESNGSSMSEISGPNHPQKMLPIQPVLSSTRASDCGPISSKHNNSFPFFNLGSTKMKKSRFGSTGSIATGNWSTSSNEEVAQPLESGKSTPGNKRDQNSAIMRQVNNWNNDLPEHNNQVPRTSTLMSEQSHEESLLLGAHSKFPQHPSLLLLDAHVIFKPLLTSLGLMPQQIIGYNFDHLGSHMSIKAAIDLLRIDIVESEGKGVGRGSVKNKNTGTLPLSLPPEIPAFLCEKIGLEGDFQKSADLSRDNLRKKSFLYLSRNYWKKQAKRSLIFSLSIDYISQQVNMPLLRLLHQITTMIQNVRETQLELREQRPSEKVKLSLNHKNSSSSGSDLHMDHHRGRKHKLSTTEPPLQPMSLSASTPLTNLQPPTTTSTTKPSRTQSFAQRFRSVRVGGPRVIIDGVMRSSSASQTPTSVRGTDFPDALAVTKREPLTSSAPVLKAVTTPPNCWKTIYYLLDLYATRPETKTVINSRSADHDHFQHPRVLRLNSSKLSDGKDHFEDMEKGLLFPEVPVLTYPTSSLEKQKESGTGTLETPRLSIFGVARIQRTRLLASLSGLKLEAEILNLQATTSYKKKLRPVGVDLSLTGHCGQAMIVLLEGVAPSQQTVVKISISQSAVLYSSISKRSKDRNSSLLTIGPVNIDIPQHPVVLHGMMTRSSKQLSNTLQEFRVNRTSSRISRGTTFDEADFAPHVPPHVPEVVPEKPKKPEPFFQPLVMHFTILAESLSITAALLPSLQAQYKMENVKSSGMTGSKANFKINLPTHTLSFTTKLTTSEANLPSAASISLPKVDVGGEYIEDKDKGQADAEIMEGVVIRRGSFLQASAQIGSFEHCLTTDLLNHLVFVQKVFMREVNEVVLKMSGGDKPVPFWEEEGATSLGSILFTLNVTLQGIQITATTPTNTAVRLETGALEFYMSNRVRRMCEPCKGPPPTSTMSSSGSHHHPTRPPTFHRVFLKAKVDVNLSLGQLIRNMVFEEAESEYQQYAFFKTHVGLTNDMSEETSGDAEKDVVLITLTRPLIYIQPVAVDKAILVWLNYKNAYEYWNEQRSSLNTEVLAAMPFQQVPDRAQPSGLHEHSSILFVQLTVDDMGISIPLNPAPHSWSGRMEAENRGAVVITLESSSISACSYGSLVSKGKFTNLCLRFSDDMVTMDDWKPNLSDPTLFNYCSVSEGTYEVCSRTTSRQQSAENAKWFLNVQWSMEGVDMHIDVNVGKQLSTLGHTLTTLAAFEEEDDDILETENVFGEQDLPDCAGLDVSTRSVSQESVVLRRQKSQGSEYIGGLSIDAGMGSRQKRNFLEKEMQERVSLITELKKIGASEIRIEDERKKLQELENVAYKDFRRDWIKKLRRQSTKGASMKDKLGLGTSPKVSQVRSPSVGQTTSSSVNNENQSVYSPLESVPSPTTSDLDSSPPEGPSRSSSIRYRSKQQRVTFGQTERQCSVESTTPDDEDELLDAWLENEVNETQLRTGLESKETVGQMTPGSSVSHKAMEPNVDLELDVKVFINSGKCALHTKAKEDEGDSKSVRKKSERSMSGFDSALVNITSSPISSRAARPNTSTTRLRSPFGNFTGTDVTIFHIPGLDVKIHYDSHVLYEEKECSSGSKGHERSDSGSSTSSTVVSNAPNFSLLNRRGGTKKASLFAWTTLHSVPEETIISPHILDFLEQTLEPIPLPANEKSFDGTSIETDGASGVASTYYASFPVDVIVYFHMQPSTFRFSCQPVSRVECMLRLPSLDIVFSSKRAEEKAEEFGSTNVSGGKYRTRHHTESGGKEKEVGQVAIGGLSVTGCLTDFSLYIFHPYGAAKKSATTDWSPLSDNERKDSVSMNVEFIKVNLSRSKKIYSTLPTSSTSEGKIFPNNSEQQASIRFSTIMDIGPASFKYDMRRLTEILAFPKAWYRRSIVRRLFLGDLSTPSAFGEEASTLNGPTSGRSSPTFHPTMEERRNSGPSNLTSGHKHKMKLNLDGEKEVKRRGSKLDFFASPKTPSKGHSEENGFQSSSKWETLVLFTVNFTKLNVQMNMGNVMGNVGWIIRDAKSDGKLSIGSSGHKNLYIGIDIGSSYIDAKGGIVAGTFELVNLSTFVKAKEDPDVEPLHTVGFKVFLLELRLDFMGTSVLMGRGSKLEVTLKDEWQVRDRNPETGRPKSDVAMATYRPAMIFIHGDMRWDQVQLLISKSTTVDLLKMHCKLEEFFSQQFKSSKWVFSTLQVQETSSTPSLTKVSIRKSGEGGLGQWEEIRHHRHWQRVLEKVSRMSISSLLNPLPATGTVLGGTMDLHGNNISLACFHGMNFKAKSWALFSLKEPFISFQTEAQETHSEESGGVHVVQNLNVALGQNQTMSLTSSPHESMAMVCRITRNVIFSPQFRTLQEWFHYAFAPSEIDDVQRFPNLERERERMEKERADSSSIERRTPARLHDPNHNREVIFALPTMELFFKTEHLQGTEGSTSGGRPTVDCSFITEFGDHIFVTVDAEAFFFLHDLILSYIKEKEKLVSAQFAAGRSQSPNVSTSTETSINIEHENTDGSGSGQSETSSSTESFLQVPSMLENSDSALQRDWRNYNCKTWQLEPTVRLLSWAGKSIEPYGVDYILHKLGFSHARTTIPKWMQRGFMDPLDKLLSVLVFRMIDLARKENQEERKEIRRSSDQGS